MVQSKAGETSTADALAGKTVGIYFSAHWCPPCRGFTPQLVESYNTMTAAGKAFEIVFVSSDRDEAAFAEYFGEMPWLALPYAKRELKAKLSKKFKVNGIPTLVIIDSDGKTITADGREAIDSDPAGQSFPWKPATLEEALGDEVLQADGESLEVKEIRDNADVLALYFSAHWCPPLQGVHAKAERDVREGAGGGQEDGRHLRVLRQGRGQLQGVLRLDTGLVVLRAAIRQTQADSLETVWRFWHPSASDTRCEEW